VDQRTEEDRSCFEEASGRCLCPKGVRAPTNNTTPDCAFLQLAPGQPIHMASCPVCTLASAFSPYRLYTSQSQPLSFAVIRAAGNEGYMAREQSKVLYTWAATSTLGLDSLAYDMCQRPTELLLVTSDVKQSRQSPSEARPPERGRLSTAVPCRGGGQSMRVGNS
jgi:hypothetical protein